MSDRTIGPHVVAGCLFFKLPDGETISCECIRDPYASQIVAMWEGRRDEPAPDDDDGVELGDKIIDSLKYVRAI